MRMQIKTQIGRIVMAAALVAGMAVPSFAGSVSGDPAGSGISASIPVSASVSDYAEITFNSCAFAAMNGPSASSNCTETPQVKSNAAINVTFTPTRLLRSGGTEHLNSVYTFKQGTGLPSANVSADPGSVLTNVAFAQAAAALDTPTTYTVNGTASVINGETVAGSYAGTISVTVVKQ